MTSSVHKGVVEACCDWTAQDRSRRCHHRYVDLLTNEIYQTLVEMYSSFIQFKMFDLEDFTNTFLYEAGPEYDGEMYLYIARVYISAFFHDLYVSNQFARQELFINPFNTDKKLDYLSRSYDRFLAYLLGSILPTEIKLTHERTLFIPRISPNIQFNDVNRNYFGINNWVYNRGCLRSFIHRCQYDRIMNMEPIPKIENGRPFWLFDWHGKNCYSWFPVEPNCTVDDAAIACIIGTPCTSILALGDYDEWQQFPGNVRPVEANPNCYERVRDLVYHGSAMVRTMEVPSFIIPKNVIVRAVERTPEGASLIEQDEEHPEKFPPRQLGSENPPTELKTSWSRKKQRLSTTDLGNQTRNYDTGLETHGRQLVESCLMSEGGDEVSQSQTASLVPAPQPGSDKEDPVVLLPNIEQFRLVDYLYDSIVIRELMEYSRSKAFHEMLKNEPN